MDDSGSPPEAQSAASTGAPEARASALSARIRIVAIALVVAIALLQYFGAGHEAAEHAASVASAPTEDLSIAASLAGLPLSGGRPSARAVQQLTAISGSLSRTAKEQDSPAIAARGVLLARFLGRAPGDSLRLATQGIPGAHKGRPDPLVQILSKNLDAMSVSDAGWLRRSRLGPAALLVAAEVYTRQGQEREAEASWTRLHNLAILAQIKAGMAALVFAVIAFGGIACWLAYRLYMAPASRESPSKLPASAEAADTGPAPGNSLALWQAFALYLATFLALAPIVAGLFGLVTHSKSFTPRSDTLAGLIHYVVTAAVAIPLAYAVMKIHRQNPKDIGLKTSDWVVDAGWGLGGFLVGITLTAALAIISRTVFEMLGLRSPDVTSPVVTFLVGNVPGWKIVSVLIAISVVAPLLEETFFRGMLLNALRRDYGLAPALWGSAILFALMHPGFPDLFIPYIGLGYVFARLATVRRSLLPSIIAHALNNLFFAAMVLLLQI